MWTFQETIRQLPQAYCDAALANVNMRAATEVLETLRSRISQAESFYKVWDAFDEQIGLASDEGLQNVLSGLRDRFEQQICSSETNRLWDAFRQDPQAAYQDWLLTYTEALTNWRLTLCLHLCSELYPFPATAPRELAWFRSFTHFVLHDRWAEAYDLFSYLSQQDMISPILRAKLFVTLGEIQLYHFIAPRIAKELLERAVELAPDEVRTIYGMGEYWLTQRENDKARIQFQRAIEIAPRQADGYIGIGDIHKALGETRAAEQSYQEALRVEGGNSSGYIRLLRLYGSPGSFSTYKDRFLYLVRRVVAISPNDRYSAYLEAGQGFQNNQAFETAHEWYQKAIELDNQRLGGYIVEGSAYLAESKYSQSHGAFQKAIQIAPEAFDGYWGLAAVFERQQLWGESVHWYQECLRRRPQWEVFLRGKIGYVKFQLGSYPEAEHEALQGLRVDPQDKTILGILLTMASDYYKKLNNPSAALGLYHEIHQILGPSFEADYQNYLGNLKYYLGEYPEAAVYYREAIKAGPTTTVYFSNLSTALLKIHDYDGARSLWTDAPQGVQQDEGLRKEMSLLWNNEANESFNRKDYSKAIQLYQEAIIFAPTDAVLHSNLSLAWEFDRSGKDDLARIERALSAIREACQHDPMNEEYKRRLRRLEELSRLAPIVGEKSLDRLPVVTPIALEVAANMIPLFEGKTASGLSSELAQLIVDMRERILRKYGVQIPGVRVRGNETDLPGGTYIIMLMEIPLVSGNISLDKRLSTAKAEELRTLDIKAESTTNPETGDDANWIAEEDWIKIQDAGLNLWQVVEYPIRHLQAVIERNLIGFVGNQEVHDLLEKHCADRLDSIAQTPGGLSVLTRIVRALLAEQVPITAFVRICERFLEPSDNKNRLFEIVEALRSLPEIRGTLPGNNKGIDLFTLSKDFEKSIKDAISRQDAIPVLAMEPEPCQAALAAVREALEGRKHTALLVEDCSIRPFVRELVELEFPGLFVLSRLELLPELTGQVIGEIDL